MKDALNTIMSNIANRDNSKEGDYIDTDGYLTCNNCKTRKQKEFEFPLGSNKWLKMPILCKCETEKRRTDEAQREQEARERHLQSLRDEGMSRVYQRYTFGTDKRHEPKMSDVSHRYARDWKEMFENDIGILFYGEVGTGKTFLSACIANAIIDKGYSAKITSFPEILNHLQSFEGDRQEYITGLNKYDLLVIDDLGAERETSFALEQVYNIIDSRTRSGKPLIVTTNLSLEEMENTKEVNLRRIYDRVLEKCSIRLKLVGNSKRKAQAEERADIARKIMRGAE